MPTSPHMISGHGHALGTSPMPRLPSLRALVVDDEETNRALVSEWLREAGANVVAKSDGDEAVEATAKGFFDVIVMDIHMPRLDGFQAARKIRAQGYQGILVAFSAFVDEGHSRQWAAFGFDAFLAKSLGQEGLIRELSFLYEGGDPAAQPGRTAPVRAEPALIQKVRIRAASPRVLAIFRRFADSLPREMKDLKRAFDQGESDSLLNATHRLKGASSNCGFLALSQQIQGIEDLLLAKTPAATIQTTIADLVDTAERSRQSFDQLLASPVEEPLSV